MNITEERAWEAMNLNRRLYEMYLHKALEATVKARRALEAITPEAGSLIGRDMMIQWLIEAEDRMHEGWQKCFGPGSPE